MNRLQFIGVSVVAVVMLVRSIKGGSMSMQSRIIDGSSINITRAPFMLSLRLCDNHICGAAILDEVWGITAAHCLTTYVANTSDYSIRSGSTYIDHGGIIHNVTSTTVHENFNDTNNDYDVAVFRVHPPFKFDKTTQPIDLPGHKHVNDSIGMVAGWGYFINFAVLSESLQYVGIPKVNFNECEEEYEGRFQLTPRQVCYGYRQGGKDSCKGDSGGPLVSTTEIFLGITSWGDGCAEAYSPGVYMSIFPVLDWVRNKSGV